MKAKITVEQEGFRWDFTKEINPDGTVHIGIGIVPLKEIRSWISTVYPEVKVIDVEVVE